MKIHPILIGILNAVLPGLGYLIIRERTVFASLMLLGLLLFSVVTFTDPSPAFSPLFLSTTVLGRFLEGISYTLISIAFGYDAYDMAKRKPAAGLIVSPASTTLS